MSSSDCKTGPSDILMVLNRDVVLTHPKIDGPVPLVEIITCSMRTGATPGLWHLSCRAKRSGGMSHAFNHASQQTAKMVPSFVEHMDQHMSFIKPRAAQSQISSPISFALDGFPE